MTQRVAFTLTILETSEDLRRFSSIFLRTVKLSLKGSGNKKIYICYRWDKCEKGLKCNKCHTTVERLYHPDKYKRIYCDVSFQPLIIYRGQDAINQIFVLSITPKKKKTKRQKNASFSGKIQTLKICQILTYCITSSWHFTKKQIRLHPSNNQKL